MSLPTIHGTNPNKILDCYKKLCSNVLSLETMGKLGEVNGYVWMALNKLEGIRGDLVRTDDQWQEWKFPQLVAALWKWTVRNPPKCDDVEDEGKQLKPLTKPPYKPPTKPPQSRSFQTSQREVKRRPRVYCNQPNHSSTNCDNATSVSERTKLLIQKQLCFDCTGPNHRAEECRCVTKFSHCRRRHHSSICENISGYKKPEHMLVATGKSSVTYPLVVVEVCGIRCRALLDTGAGSSCASAALLDRIGK